MASIDRPAFQTSRIASGPLTFNLEIVDAPYQRHCTPRSTDDDLQNAVTPPQVGKFGYPDVLSRSDEFR